MIDDDEITGVGSVGAAVRHGSGTYLRPLIPEWTAPTNESARAVAWWASPRHYYAGAESVPGEAQEQDHDDSF